MKPQTMDGKSQAKATVICETDLTKRVVVTQLHQRRADGSYEPVWGASSVLEVPEQLNDATYEADGPLIGCRQISGDRRFKSIVMVSDRNGNLTETESNFQEFHKDCIDGDQQEIISEPQDEVIDPGCTDDVCAESHLANAGQFYGCSVRSGNPVLLNNRLVGDGRFNCTTRLYKRFVYVKVCDDVRFSGDPCTDMTSRYLNRDNGSWTGSPACRLTPVTYRGPIEYRGSYSKAGIDPRKQENGNIPANRWVDSPRTDTGRGDCNPCD
ncbi:MAG: hypothetical protein IT338_11330 [Thermomicrobiales bacterium]|nr:hypothetical protein [Thermomicrobiales bacterium]